MKVSFENGKIYYGSARTNYYLRAFFADLCSRPSCYKCQFKHIQHISDLTLYDSWHAAELADLQDDDKGYTNIIIQSSKGKKLLDKRTIKQDIFADAGNANLYVGIGRYCVFCWRTILGWRV